MNDYSTIFLRDLYRIERDVLVKMAKIDEPVEMMRGAVAMVEAIESYIEEREPKQESATD